MNNMQTAGIAEAGMKQLIRFTVGTEEYGLELLHVKEIMRMHQITRLPQSPHCVKGIFSLRGEVIPIIDLRDRLGLPPLQQSSTTRIIVVEVEDQPVGLAVDSASQVMRIPTAQITPPPPVMGGFSQELICGVGKIDEQLVILLDVDGILSHEEKLQLGNMRTEARGFCDMPENERRTT